MENSTTKEKNRALIIVDMQKGLFTPETPRYNAERVISHINALAEIFREKNYPVIYIQHNGTATNEYIPNTLEWEIIDELKVYNSDIIIEKYANDAFYNSKLNDKLVELNVNELYVTGCATDFCVEAIIQSAIAKDYNITVVSDGHTTGDRPHLNAEKIIEHYNWIWQNMIPTRGGIKVCRYQEIKKEAAI